jgi:hypothetical protein
MAAPLLKSQFSRGSKFNPASQYIYCPSRCCSSLYISNSSSGYHTFNSKLNFNCDDYHVCLYSRKIYVTTKSTPTPKRRLRILGRVISIQISLNQLFTPSFYDFANILYSHLHDQLVQTQLFFILIDPILLAFVLSQKPSI